MKSVVTISRKWKSPIIESWVCAEDVGSKMELDKFLESLVEHVGNPTTLITKKQFLAKLVSATEAIKEEMKDKTKHVV